MPVEAAIPLEVEQIFLVGAVWLTLTLVLMLVWPSGRRKPRLAPPGALSPFPEPQPNFRPGRPDNPRVSFAECVHPKSGEDRILQKQLGGMYPVVIVADGVSEVRGETNVSAITAQQASDAALEYLDANWAQMASVDAVMLHLRGAFHHARRTLHQRDTPGATTLLVAMLWWPDSEDAAYWCYAYEGDGFIGLVSPSRRLDTILGTEQLLVEQRVDQTATIRSAGMMVPPAVNCRAYETGEILYVASDGLLPLSRWVREHNHETLSEILLRDWDKPDVLKRVARGCRNYDDDAVLGIIGAS